MPTITKTMQPTYPWRYFVAVDLGNLNDRTAITVGLVSRAYEVETHHYGSNTHEASRVPEFWLMVEMLHRPRIGIGYEKIIDQVVSIVRELPPMPEEPITIWDATGLGAPVLALARRQLPKAVGITITGGNEATTVGKDWTVPKALLVGEARLMLSRQRLKIAAGFQEREQLMIELQAFQAKLSASGRATFAAAGPEHDDTVMSLAMIPFALKQIREGARMMKFNWIAMGG
jgi:hypothetical protein